jgi:hypothetical protein
MTGSIPAEFPGVTLPAVTTLVCDAQHENIDFAGDIATFGEEWLASNLGINCFA